MTANVNPETGISYGVIDARKCSELYNTITSDGTNVTLKAAEDDVKERLKSHLEDLDLKEVFAKNGITSSDNDDDDDDEISDRKNDAVLEALTEIVERATEFRGRDAEKVAEDILDYDVDVDDCTVNVDAAVATTMQALNDAEYFSSDGEDDYEYSDGGYEYLLSHLGGAPLIWVTKSPFITYCRTCSPCVPNAGDLDNCRSEEESNCIAYCVDPDDIDDDEDKPVLTRHIVGSDIGDIAYQRPIKPSGEPK